MTITTSLTAAISFSVASPVLAATPAAAQAPAEFYKGRTVEIIVGYSVGGGYDQYARMIARHMGRCIPGSPTCRSSPISARPRSSG